MQTAECREHGKWVKPRVSCVVSLPLISLGFEICFLNSQQRTRPRPQSTRPKPIHFSNETSQNQGSSFENSKSVRFDIPLDTSQVISETNLPRKSVAMMMKRWRTKRSMNPKTKQNMPSLTLTGKSKATTEPGLVASYDIQPKMECELQASVQAIYAAEDWHS